MAADPRAWSPLGVLDVKPATGTDRLVVAYLMSRFPKLSETFVLYEILELERLGHRVEVFPLLHEHEPVIQPGAQELVARAHYLRLASREVAAAQLHWLRRAPRRYLGLWVAVLRGNARSVRFLLRALAVVPVAAAFARRAEQLGVEHIHAHWATHPALAAFVIRRLTGLPYSFTAHAHDIFVDRTMLREKIEEAAFVATISDHNRRLLRGWYGELANRIEVIRCGVDASVFTAVRGRRPGGRLVVLCVASLQPQKGHSVLLNAVARLVARGIPVLCLLAGEGRERPRLEAQIADLRIGDNVQLLGMLSRTAVVQRLAEADVVVQPSIVLPTGKTEGIPVALMEALAMERPVVASAVSGIPELVEDDVSGLLVPPGDDKALADALAAIQASPELARRLGTAGRRRVLEHHDLQRNTRGLADLFARAARRRKPPFEPTAEA